MIGKRKQFKLIDETPNKVNGEWDQNEETVYRGWGEFTNARSDRSVLNNQTQIDKFFEVKFRNNGQVSVNANSKLVYNGNRYTVTGIRRDSEKRFYWILSVQAKDYG